MIAIAGLMIAIFSAMAYQTLEIITDGISKGELEELAKNLIRSI